MNDINDYLKQIAMEYVPLSHTEEKPAFFRERSTARILIDNTELISKMNMAADNIMIAQFTGSGSITGTNTDSQLETDAGTIYLMGKVKSTEDYAGIDTVKANNKVHIRQIIARIRKDVQKRIVPQTYLPERVGISDVGLVGENYYGTAYFFEFKERQNFQYDDTKWISS